MEKDLKNILFTFGIVAITLFGGSDVYARNELRALEEQVQTDEETREQREQTFSEQKENLEATIRLLEAQLVSEQSARSALAASVAQMAEVKPVVRAQKPASQQVSIATPEPDPIDVAALRARIAALAETTKTLNETQTRATTNVSTSSNTQTTAPKTVVRSSRRSRAS